MPNIIRNAPTPWVRCIFSLRKTTLAKTIRMRLNKVMKVVMVVELSANFGILRSELLVNMNENLAARAKTMDIIKRQLKMRFKKLSTLNRFPDMRDRFPSKTMEAVVVMEKTIIQKITIIILISYCCSYSSSYRFCLLVKPKVLPSFS